VTIFKSITIQGVTYDFNHLMPMTLAVTVRAGKPDEKTFSVLVNFGCHCFTEEHNPDTHTPDYRYEHDGEVRAFCQHRYARSQGLPGIINGVGNRPVFITQQNNYMLVEMTTHDGATVPYTIFFSMERGKKGRADVVMTVVSAYDKPAVTDKAPKVKFGTLVAKTSRGEKVTPTTPQRTKRK
jgi:hypothetical protein